MTRAGALAAAACLGASTLARAQDVPCGAWLPFDSLPGTDGSISRLLPRDPDGAGPLPPEILAVGNFSFAGDVRARGLALWDGARWRSLGDMIDSYDQQSFATAVAPNGDVIVAGNFESIAGCPARCVARWDGSTWSAVDDSLPGIYPGGARALAVGLDGTIYASSEAGIFRKLPGGWESIATEYAWGLHIGPAGEVYAFGSFTRMGGRAIAGLARWDDGEWAPVGREGSGVRGVVMDMASFDDGSLVIRGSFTSVDGVNLRNFARWDGQQWASLPGLDAQVVSRIENVGGSLIVRGSVRVNPGPYVSIAEWDGQQWSTPPYPPNLGPMYESPEGVRYAANGADLVRLIGGDTVPVGGNDISGAILALASSGSGETVCGGDFVYGGGTRLNNVAIRRDGVWRPMGSGLTGIVGDLLTLSDGRILATMSPGVSGANFTGSVMAWDGSTWSQLGAEFRGGSVGRLAQLPDGSVVCAGSFSNADGLAANKIARWDGTRWNAMGSGPGGGTSPVITDLAVALGGQLFVTGDFVTMSGVATTRLARWDGRAWFAVPGAPSSAPEGLASLPNGDLVAYGSFRMGGSDEVRHICRWDGEGWTPMAPRSAQEILAMTVTGAGEVFAFFNRTLHALVNEEWVPVSVPMTEYAGTGRQKMLATDDGEIQVGGGAARAFGRWSPNIDSPPAVEAFTDTPLVARDSNITLRAIAGGNEPWSWVWEIENDDGWRPVGSTVYHNHQQIGWVLNAGSDTVIRTFYPNESPEILRFRCVASFSPCLSVSTEPVEVRFCIADYDRNGEVDWQDLAAFVAAWDLGRAPDLNLDWCYDADDLSLFITRWEEGC